MENEDEPTTCHHERQTPSPIVYSTWYSPVISMRAHSMTESIPDSMETVFAKSREVSMSPLGASHSNCNPPPSGLVTASANLHRLGLAREACWTCCCCVRAF